MSNDPLSPRRERAGVRACPRSMQSSSLLIALALISACRADPADQQQHFPRAHRPVAPIVGDSFSTEDTRDRLGEAEQVMALAGVKPGMWVADIGAGAGWFTIRLARRVGPNGVVYAEDVQPEMLAAIRRRVEAEVLMNVKPILGKGSDPRLPSGALDAVLMVDAYHEIDDRVPMLRNLAKALRPGGRIGVVDFKLEGSGPGPAMEERISPETVVADARSAGLRLLSQETFLPYQYFLIFGLEKPPPMSP